MFEYQPPAVLNQGAPVQNTWYVLLPETPLCRVYDVAVNIEDTDETLEVQATVDGELIGGGAVACTNSSSYIVIVDPNPITRLDNLTLAPWNTHILAKAFTLEGHLVEIEVRKTTAAGVGNLTGIATHGVLVDTP